MRINRDYILKIYKGRTLTLCAKTRGLRKLYLNLLLLFSLVSTDYEIVLVLIRRTTKSKSRAVTASITYHISLNKEKILRPSSI